MGRREEVLLDRKQLEHVLKFKYLECVLNESDIDGHELCRKVASGRKVTGSIRSSVNSRCF